MIIKQIVTNSMGENAYICIDGGEALICDPGGAADEIISELDGAKAKYILLTHGHFDHIAAAEELRKKCGAPIVISKDDKDIAENGGDGRKYGIFIPPLKADLFSEDTEIKIGESLFRVLKTPGHTKGSVCYLCDDVLLSGDVLFEGTIGKFEREDAETIIKSVMSLAKLPDNVQVFPGHGEATTIGREKINNPYLMNNE